jgi:hypothetical protein
MQFISPKYFPCLKPSILSLLSGHSSLSPTTKLVGIPLFSNVSFKSIACWTSTQNAMNCLPSANSLYFSTINLFLSGVFTTISRSLVLKSPPTVLTVSILLLVLTLIASISHKYPSDIPVWDNHILFHQICPP